MTGSTRLLRRSESIVQERKGVAENLDRHRRVQKAAGDGLEGERKPGCDLHDKTIPDTTRRMCAWRADSLDIQQSLKLALSAILRDICESVVVV